MIIMKSMPMRVISVQEKMTRAYVSGYGADAKFVTRSEGWYVSLEDWVSVYAGSERPHLDAGDRVTITVDRVS